MGISPKSTVDGGRAGYIVWPTGTGAFHRLNSTNSLALFFGGCITNTTKKGKKVILEGRKHPVSAYNLKPF